MRWVPLGVVGVMMITSAGACQQDWDGPLPPPDEVGAAPFPDGAVVGGLDAVFATLYDTTRSRADGLDVERRCYTLLRLHPDGTAETTSSCVDGDGIAESAAAAATWQTTRSVGDYALVDEGIALRLVDWDVIVEDFELVETTMQYCVDGLYGRTFSGAVAVTAELVVGSAPPDAEPCTTDE